MYRPSFLVSATIVLLTASISWGKPVGYERLIPLTEKSGVFTQLTPNEVYENYARELSLGTASNDEVTDKRLIDIETHRDKNGKLTLSGIWIENKGSEEVESWLMLDLSWGDLILYAQLWKDIVPLDLERYDNKKGQLRYAVIFQRNTHKTPWYVMPDTTNNRSRPRKRRSIGSSISIPTTSMGATATARPR